MTPAASDDCPSAGLLDELLEDRLDPAVRDQVEHHVGTCPTCRERILSAVGLTSVDASPNRTSGSLERTPTFEPSTSFLDRLRESIRRQLASIPCPSPVVNDLVGSTSSPRLPMIRGIEILDEVGRGGMGVVHRARQIGLDRIVALKLLWGGSGSDREVLSLLTRGPRTIARLDHPHIVRIYQVGKQDSWYYGILEYLAGGDLRSAIRAETWSFERVVSLMRVLAETVHYLHEQGILHCDLKASNILLSSTGVPKIADFGLVRFLKEDHPFLPDQEGSVLGTPSSMAPEQIVGGGSVLGVTTDIYGLGVILYELLVGHPPFPGETREETFRRVLEEAPVPPSKIRPEVPRELEAICLRCLEKSPRLRHANSLELARELANHASTVDDTAAPYSVARQQEPDEYADLLAHESEAERSRVKAEIALNEAEAILYARRLALARKEWERGELSAARSRLVACVPRPGRPDFRESPWFDLWKQCQDE